MQSSGNLSYLIDAPADAQVKVNGILLGSDYVKESNVPAGTYDRYKTSSAAPTVTRYEISELMSEPEITAEGYVVVKDAYEERFYVGKAASGDVKSAGEKTMTAIAEAAARYQVALEINNSSFVSSRVGSEDNCRAIAAAVRDAGGWVALGSDSHTAFTLGEFTECRKILDAVDFPEERILNVSPRRLLNFLESRGMPAIPEFADL